MSIEQSHAIVTNSLMNMGNLMNYNDPIINFSFLKLDGRACPSGVNILTPKESARSVDMFFLPQIVSVKLCEKIKSHQVSQDVTITNLTDNLLNDISSQIDPNITVHTMWMNRHEFIIYFNILCDYINDINLTINIDTDNQYINDIKVEKNSITDSLIVFKLYQDFRVYNRGV